MKFGLTGNPFEIKTVHDLSDFEIQPFLLLKNQRVLKTKLEFNVDSKFPLYQIIIGDRGIGKSTTLLYLYKTSINDKTLSFYISRPLTQINSILELLGLRETRTQIITSKESKEDSGTLSRIKSHISGKKVFLFIDMPDKVTSSILGDFLGVLEVLLDCKEISIFLALNRSHYDRSFMHSEILGKYSSIELEPFTYEETEQLIIERLNQAKKDVNGTKPFTEESLQKIYSFSNGIPRNIISACDLLLMSAVESNNVVIDGKFTSKKLQSEYAYKIINERVRDLTTRENLKKVYDFIKIAFKGTSHNEKELHSKFAERYGGASMTLRKRIRLLEKLGLIEIRKSPKDMWSNQIILKG